MSDLCLVTGATGFIGGRVAALLVARGRAVRVLVRRERDLDPALARQVEVVVGDLRQPEAVRAATAGVESVIHLAGLARAWMRDEREFEAVNVDGVACLLEGARRGGVRRLIHVSTILADPPARRAPEPVCRVPETPYERTKRAGEQLVLAYAAEGRHAVTVLPSRVYGPGPMTDANAATRTIVQYLAGQLPLRLADRDVLGNYVFIEDVADGILRAESSGKPGGRYPLGGENVSFAGFLELVDQITGSTRRTLAVPPRLGLMLGTFSEAWARLGGQPLIPRGWVRILLEDRPMDSTESMRTLGYAPRPLRTGLEQTLRWLTDQGKVR